ncbi:hypothetical protein [Helicobacter pylori]|uniref:hypothetical protein n=1 Tax=Helicobacter pylori TaxID=210 RepID=UPI001C56AD7B|nr:hypothetical protein [Helicobacter pylori]
MWKENVMKVIPAILFLFCLLETFELALIINNMDRSEKLEDKIENSLKVLERITILSNEHLEGMDLKHSKDKKVKIK